MEREVVFDTIIKKKSKKHQVSKLQNWVWPAIDHGTWSYDPEDEDGPVNDWNEYHSKKWFKHVRNFDVAIQAGGACGMYPRMLAEKFKAVYTFEPTPISFHCLVNNNQLQNVVKIQGALGDHQGFVEIAFVNENVGMSRIQDGPGAFVPLFTLDSFNFERCDLLALDVEGDEHAVLLGAHKLLTKHYPVVIIEAGSSANRCKLYLRSLGYKFAEDSAMDLIFIPDLINNEDKSGEDNGQHIREPAVS